MTSTPGMEILKDGGGSKVSNLTALGLYSCDIAKLFFRSLFPPIFFGKRAKPLGTGDNVSIFILLL